FWVEAGGRTVNGVRTGTGTTPTLVLADMEAMLRDVPALKACSPQVDAQIQVIHGRQNWRTSYRGVSPEYLDVRSWRLASGDIFGQAQVDSAANVCVLGATVVEHLFPGEDPVGSTLRVGNIPFRVLGTLEAKGQTAQGRDQDDFILVPFTTAQRKLKGVTWLDDIMCSVAAAALAPKVESEVNALLRERHRILPGEADA